MSKRSGSLDSRTNSARMHETRDEFINVRDLIKGENGDPKMNTLRATPAQDYKSAMKQRARSRQQSID